MCIIIDNNTAGKIPAENLKRALKSNPDGCGVAFVRDGRVFVGKSTKEKEINQLINTYNTPGSVFHFRIKTHGEVGKSNCHPFVILSKTAGDPFDLVMFHNGILSFTDELRSKDETRTDSELFAAHYLRPILSKTPDLIYDKFFQNWLSHTAKGSKLVFLTSKNEHIIINKDAGEVEGGIWYSNNSAFKQHFTTYGSYYNPYKYLIQQYYYDMAEKCPADNRGEVSLLRYTAGADPDQRLSHRPAYTGRGAAEFNTYLMCYTLRTKRGLYFYYTSGAAWVEIVTGSIDKFLDLLDEELVQNYAYVGRD